MNYFILTLYAAISLLRAFKMVPQLARVDKLISLQFQLPIWNDLGKATFASKTFSVGAEGARNPTHVLI